MILYFSNCINRYFIVDDNEILKLNDRSFYLHKSEAVRSYCDYESKMAKMPMVNGITMTVVFEFETKDQLLTKFAEILI